MYKILLISGLCYHVLGEDMLYRFDYEFSSQANGWLKFHPIPAQWQEARRRCYAEGAVLASPLTTQLKAAILSFVLRKKNSVPTVIFTGVHASFSKGDYSSIEGIHWLRMPIVWGTGEPDNFENAESCLAMMTDSKGSMSDVKCSDVLPYVCYKRYTHLTMTECGTTDPAYKLEPRTGSCYKFHVKGLPWDQAYLTCIAEGGHLIVINSPVEREIAGEMISAKISSSHTLAGFHDWGLRVSFWTIHGEPVENEYLKWEANEPSNSSNSKTTEIGEFCGSLSRKAEMNDAGCSSALTFICEKNPRSLSHYNLH